MSIILTVLKGMSVVRAIENNKTGAQDRPIEEVKIVDCSVRTLDEPIAVERTDATE